MRKKLGTSQTFNFTVFFILFSRPRILCFRLFFSCIFIFCISSFISKSLLLLFATINNNWQNNYQYPTSHSCSNKNGHVWRLFFFSYCNLFWFILNVITSIWWAYLVRRVRIVLLVCIVQGLGLIRWWLGIDLDRLNREPAKISLSLGPFLYIFSSFLQNLLTGVIDVACDGNWTRSNFFELEEW